MSQAQELEMILHEAENVQMDTEFVVEVIDEKTGLVKKTITLPAGNYAVYQNYDLEYIGEIRKFIEDPNTSFNRLLRLADQE